MKRIFDITAILTIVVLITSCSSDDDQDRTGSTGGSAEELTPEVEILTPPSTPTPTPAPPIAPVPIAACTVPNDPATLPAIGPGVTGGVFRGNNLNLPANVTLNLTSDLIVVTQGALNVMGKITYAVGPNGPLNPGARIILVSLTANVVVGPNALVGKDAAQVLPRIPPGGARGATGVGAGSITIIASQAAIHNQGTIAGMHGQTGADASHFPAAGQAGAVGGNGGKGADVTLCAKQNITNDDWIESGGGGSGGSASTIAGNNAIANSTGGRGGAAGNVNLVGFGPNPVPVINNSRILGNLGGKGGFGIATGGANGGTGNAVGGRSNIGGSISFTNVVMNPVGILRVGSGGDGGNANATGGPGGGNADASGGPGGPDGAMPAIPVAAGAPAGAWGAIRTINPGNTGKGGDARAAGGAAPPAGAPGTLRAKGGVGKSGAAPGVMAPVPGVPRTVSSTSSL